MQLEAVRTLEWPDEVPLFCGEPWRLVGPTMGTPPFGAGPWPERGFSPDPLAPIHEEARERAVLARRTFSLSGGSAPTAAALGNPEGVQAARERYESFLKDAGILAGSAAAFAARYRVFDDAPLWRRRMDETKSWMAALDPVEREIRAAMRSMGF